MVKIKGKKFSFSIDANYNGKEGDQIGFTVINNNENSNGHKSITQWWNIKEVQDGGRTIIHIENRMGIIFQDEDFSQIISFVTEYGMKWL